MAPRAADPVVGRTSGVHPEPHWDRRARPPHRATCRSHGACRRRRQHDPVRGPRRRRAGRLLLRRDGGHRCACPRCRPREAPRLSRCLRAGRRAVDQQPQGAVRRRCYRRARCAVAGAAARSGVRRSGGAGVRDPAPHAPATAHVHRAGATTSATRVVPVQPDLRQGPRRPSPGERTRPVLGSRRPSIAIIPTGTTSTTRAIT